MTKNTIITSPGLIARQRVSWIPKLYPYVTGITFPGVSVITCTNRPQQMANVLFNYLNQNYVLKELIVVLNKNSINLSHWQIKTAKYSDIRVFQLDEKKSLGECLNFAVTQSRFNYIAKFDDDDYYGCKYLQSSIPAFFYTRADIIGKCSMYVYFNPSKTLVLLTPHNEDCYVESVKGATIIVKKEVFNKLQFSPVTLGEDTDFLTRCARNKLVIYSTSRFNYVNIRGAADEHTWQLDELNYLKSFPSYQTISHDLSLSDVHKLINTGQINP